MAALTQQPMSKLSDPTEEPLLPEGWKQTLPVEQHQWVSKALFTRDASGKLKLTEPLQRWWYPPEPHLVCSQPPPQPDPFFHSRLFLWMPCHMLGYRLMCTNPNCRRFGNLLMSRGLWENVRRVLDLSGWFFIATENLECSSCKRKVAGWSQDVMDQLEPIKCETFPVVLTCRLFCDKRILSLMRGQAPRNIVTKLYGNMCVWHEEQWLQQSVIYLSTLKMFEDLSTITVRVPEMIPVPSPSHLLSVFVKDVLTRLGDLKAKVTSICGSILTIASTKKVTKKFADSAVWATSIGNEVGQVLTCVLTQTKDEGLIPMCSGLMDRYRQAGEPSPKILYVDCNCCGPLGEGKSATLFHEWDQLVVRLDPYQFMRRFSAGVTSESHPFYNAFMGRLFSCVFKWDDEDVERLDKALWNELEAVHAGMYTKKKILGKPTSKELLRHCRHYTRGARVTECLIEQLLKDFMGISDLMGNRLVDQKIMEEIWRVQRRHLLCIQDCPGVQLYKKLKDVNLAGVLMPLYSCPRGLASLESFHKYLNNFIPGIRQNDFNFQMYLIEGLVQWNEARAAAFTEGGSRQDTYFSSRLTKDINRLSQMVLGYNLVEGHTCPEYTGELIGVEYLYSQNNRVLEVDHNMDPDAPDERESDDDMYVYLEEDEFEDLGFDGCKSLEFLDLSLSLIPIQHQTGHLQSSSSERSQPDIIVSSTSGPIKDESTSTEHFISPGISQEDDDKCLGPDDVPGYGHVIMAIKEMQEQADISDVNTTASTMALNSVLHDDQEPLHGHTIKQEVDASGQVQCVQTQPPVVQETPNATPLQKNPATKRTNLRVPRTTAWRRRKAAQQGFPVKRPCEQYACQKCGKPKTKEFGHSQFRSVHFCSVASGKTVEQWMQEMRRGNTDPLPTTCNC